ncbi:MAG: hypothetical protein LBS48_03245 [Treponema sp.]|nr:hypothetical protein [Treponema sp.]
MDSFGVALSTFVAQNYGARLYDRARKGVLVCAGMSVGIVFVISGVIAAHFGLGLADGLFRRPP